MNKLTVPISGLLSIIISVCVTFSVIDSCYQIPPVLQLDANAKIDTTRDYPILSVSRAFRPTNTYKAVIAQEITNGQQTIPLSENTVSSAFTRTYILPSNLTGTWCVNATLRYNYRLSIRTHERDLEPLCVQL